MRSLLYATLSIGSVIFGSQADDAADDGTATTSLLRSGALKPSKPALFSEHETQVNNESAPSTTTTTNNKDKDPLAEFGNGKIFDMMKKKEKRKRKRKKNKRKKRSKNGKGSKNDPDREPSGQEGDGNYGSGPQVQPTTPTPRPPSSPSSDPNSVNTFTDGGNHKLPPHSEHNNIVVESGSTLTVTSETSIEGKGGTYNRGIAAAITVSESSLKVQGMEIYIEGSSYMDHEDANFGGVGGDGILFMSGSKAMIGCEAFQPPTTTIPKKQECAMGYAAPFGLAESLVCNFDEFCMLDPMVCNNKSGVHYGHCERKPEVCTMNWLPVCGCNGVTYGNACGARSAGQSISRKGECDKSDPPEPPVEPTFCEIDSNGGHPCRNDEVCLLDTGTCHRDDHDYHDNEYSHPTSRMHPDIDPNISRMNRGTCVKTADYCREIPRVVCTCDGQTYPNECEMMARGGSLSEYFGKGVAHRGECNPEPPKEPTMCKIDPNGIDDCGSDEFCMLQGSSDCDADQDMESNYVGICVNAQEGRLGLPKEVCTCEGETYPNELYENLYGKRIAYRGACESEPSLRKCEVGPLALPSCNIGEFCELESGTCEASKDMAMQGVGVCRPAPMLCKAQYLPVCGCDGRTYSNACSARSRRMSIAYEGPCLNDGEEPQELRRCETGPAVIHFACNIGEYCDVEPGTCKVGSWDINRGVCKPRPTRGCPENYAPVCGCDGLSYDNDCFAKAKGASISYKGRCKDDGSVELPPPPPTPPPPCRGNQCINPDTGECDREVLCIVNPCIYTTCITGSECRTNYCGGCHATCVPIGTPNISPAAAPQLELPESALEDPEVVELKTEPPIVWPVDTDVVVSPVECDDSMIEIMGGAGNPRADGGSGRGGVALRVYGQTNVHINGATLSGGMGSIRGLALEIAEAKVTIHSANIDGGILVAKRGSLYVHGGTFTNGDIEVLGDTSSVTFVGCFDNLRHDTGDDHTKWSFTFSGEKSSIGVVVHRGGDIAWDQTGHECNGVVDPRPCPINQCYDSIRGECSTMVTCMRDPCSEPNACDPGYGCFPDYCGGCNAMCYAIDPPKPPNSADPCEPNACLNPKTGLCTTAMARCSENPCSAGTCMPNERCTLNSCGGCHAVCTSP